MGSACEIGIARRISGGSPGCTILVVLLIGVGMAVIESLWVSHQMVEFF